MGFFQALKDNLRERREDFKSIGQPMRHAHFFSDIGFVLGHIAGFAIGVAATVVFYGVTQAYGLAALAVLGAGYGALKENTSDGVFNGTLMGPLVPLALPWLGVGAASLEAGIGLDALIDVSFSSVRDRLTRKPEAPSPTAEIPQPVASAFAGKTITGDFRRSSEMSPDATVAKRKYAPLLNITM